VGIVHEVRNRSRGLLAITLPFRRTRRNNNSRSAPDQRALLGLPLRASFFAFLSRRFCLRSLAATFLVLLPPLSLVPISTSRPATETEAEPYCLTPSPPRSSFWYQNGPAQRCGSTTMEQECPKRTVTRSSKHHWDSWYPTGAPILGLPDRGQPRTGAEAAERLPRVLTGRPALRGSEFQRVGNPERVKVSIETPSGFFASRHRR